MQDWVHHLSRGSGGGGGGGGGFNTTKLSTLLAPLGVGIFEPMGTGCGRLMRGSTWLGLPPAMGAGMPPPDLHGALGLACGRLGAPSALGSLGLKPNCLMSVLRGGGRRGGECVGHVLKHLHAAS
ncbi:hypothetical protein E2C01_004363 [Portunus trituberculatus]|uniref:Uncharacterized protein n=1 Tax=Portunus trituberculatus TaxID=210409 RepID=A0A5B7CPS6_PORTR|nr:hypothetical protein [Portunus trituberculatus]